MYRKRIELRIIENRYMIKYDIIKKGYNDRSAFTSKDETLLKIREYQKNNCDRFVCKICNFKTYSSTLFQKHNTTIKHQTNSKANLI